MQLALNTGPALRPGLCGKGRGVERVRRSTGLGESIESLGATLSPECTRGLRMRIHSWIGSVTCRRCGPSAPTGCAGFASNSLWSVIDRTPGEGDGVGPERGRDHSRPYEGGDGNPSAPTRSGEGVGAVTTAGRGRVW